MFCKNVDSSWTPSFSKPYILWGNLKFQEKNWGTLPFWGTWVRMPFSYIHNLQNYFLPYEGFASPDGRSEQKFLCIYTKNTQVRRFLPWTPDLAHTHGLVPKSGTSTSCVLGGARFHRLLDGVMDFTAPVKVKWSEVNQLGIVEGAGISSLKAELTP